MRSSLRGWAFAVLLALPYVAGAVYLAYIRWFDKPTLVLSSGAPGGLYVQAGKQIADVLTENFVVLPMPSTGAGENVERIESGVAQLAFARDGLAIAGPKVNALARLYRSHLQIVVPREANISEVADLRGRRWKAYLGPKDSGTRAVADLVLKQYGVKADQIDVSSDAASWSLAQAASAMKNGVVDLAFFSVGIGGSALTELAVDGRFVLLNVDRADALVLANPFFEKTQIPPGAYPSVTEFPATSITTIASYELLICNADLSNRRAYKILEELFSRAPQLMRAFPLLTQLSPVDPERNFYYPLHPGAATFYRRLREPSPITWQLLGAVGTYTATMLAWLLLFVRRRRVLHLVTALRSLNAELHQINDALSIEEWNRYRERMRAIQREAAQLFLVGKIKSDPYDSLKEYLNICAAELHRHWPPGQQGPSTVLVSDRL